MGIDCNAPPGTPIATPFSGEVIDIFDDSPEPQGWGPRVIVATTSSRAPFLVFGHLDALRHPIGRKLSAGEIIGEIGPPPLNGYWFPHLHLQVVSAAAFHRHVSIGLESLDGYGHTRDQETLVADFPDPNWLIEDQRCGGMS